MSKPLALTELVLRDAHQSLLATRMRIEDMLPIAEKLDKVGYWSMESWGGATFDSCIRYLGEDPWERIRLLKQAMPNTKQQMLLRGQNLLGYRHYADDVVEAFIAKAADNGMDIFRIFDAMNDVRNLQTAIAAGASRGALAGVISCSNWTGTALGAAIGGVLVAQIGYGALSYLLAAAIFGSGLLMAFLVTDRAMARTKDYFASSPKAD